MTIKILQPGAQTLIMDAGRPGHRHQGIPGGGAADKLSFAIANHLVGNRWDTPAIECALGGLHIKFEMPQVIAISGANMWSQNQGLNLPMNKAVQVNAGDIVYQMDISLHYLNISYYARSADQNGKLCHGLRNATSSQRLSTPHQRRTGWDRG